MIEQAFKTTLSLKHLLGVCVIIIFLQLDLRAQCPIQLSSISGHNTSFCGGNDGSITFLLHTPFSNFDLSYEYNSTTINTIITTDGNGIAYLNNLNEGEYTILSIGQSGCFADNLNFWNNIIISDPVSTEAWAGSFVMPSNCGLSDASIMIYGFPANSSFYNLTYFDGTSTTTIPTISSNSDGQIFIENLSALTYSDFELFLNGCPVIFYNTPVVGSEPTLPAPFVQPFTNPFCENEQIEIGVNTFSTEVIEWFDSNDLATVISTGTPFYPPTIIGTQEYCAKNNLNGCESMFTCIEIEIMSEPLPPIIEDKILCEGTAISIPLYGNSGGVVYYYDDNLLTNELGSSSVDITGNESGVITYYVTEEVNNCSSNPTSFTVTFIPQPSPPIVINGGEYCEGQTIPDLVATPNYGGTINWYSDPDLTNLISEQPNFQPNPDPGTHTYYVTEINNSCESLSTIVEVIVHDFVPQHPNVDLDICYVDAINEYTVIPQQGGEINWYTSSGADIWIQTGETISVNPTTGISTFYFSETVNGCESPLSHLHIEIGNDLTINEIENSGDYCYGEQISDLYINTNNYIEWFSDPDLTTAIGNGNTFSPFSNLGSTTYYAVATDDYCKGNILSATVIINEYPEITLAPASCSEDGYYSVSFNASSFETILVNAGEISPGLISNIPLGTDLIITVSNGNCQTIESIVSPSDCNSPCGQTPTVQEEYEFCSNLISTISATGTNGELTWYIDPELNNPIASGNTILPNSTPGSTIYYVTETIGNCTSNAATIVVTIYELPTNPSLDENYILCDNQSGSITIQPNGISNDYSWYSDPGLTTLIEQGAFFTPPLIYEETTYFVVNINGKCTSEYSKFIVKYIQCNDNEMEIPTAFTPNGDGKNDIWEIPGLAEKYPENTVEVYNRWGNLIFESKGYKNPWDGTYYGNELPVASYFFIIQFNDGITERINGAVSIIRN